MSQTVFVNEQQKQFVEICWIDEPYFFATRREGSVGEFGTWEMLEVDLDPWDVQREWATIIREIADELGEGWSIAAEHDQPAIDITSTLLAGRYGVEIPERLARFFDGGEWRDHQGSQTLDPPMWSTSFEVRFDHPGVHMLWDRVEFNDETPRENYVPLTPLIGGDTNEFLAADIRSPDVPVAMWYHGSGKFYPYHDSLDEFLEALE